MNDSAYKTYLSCFFAQKELSIWAGSELYAILAIGYADEAPAARARKRIEEVTEWRV